MSIVDKNGNPVQPNLDTQQVVQLMTGLRIRIDAANAQLVQLGLLVEYLYENLENKFDIKMDMESFPTWAEARYKEIQAQAEAAMKQNSEVKDAVVENIKSAVKEAGINLDDTENTDTDTTDETTDEVTDNVDTTTETE